MHQASVLLTSVQQRGGELEVKQTAKLDLPLRKEPYALYSIPWIPGACLVVDEHSIRLLCSATPRYRPAFVHQMPLPPGLGMITAMTQDGLEFLMTFECRDMYRVLVTPEPMVLLELVARNVGACSQLACLTGGDLLLMGDNDGGAVIRLTPDQCYERLSSLSSWAPLLDSTCGGSDRQLYVTAGHGQASRVCALQYGLGAHTILAAEHEFAGATGVWTFSLNLQVAAASKYCYSQLVVVVILSSLNGLS